MTWFKIDDGFYDHPKFLDLPNAAVGLWAKAGAWCGRHLTDGVIPASQVRVLKGTPAQIRVLLEVGLWVECESDSGAKCYRFHDWEDFQPTREQKLQERANSAERQRRSRERRQVGANLDSIRTRSEHELHPNVTSNRTELASEHGPNLHTNRTRTRPESNSPNSHYQHEQENVTRDSHVTPSRDKRVSHTQVSHRPDPTRPDPTNTGVEVAASYNVDSDKPAKLAAAIDHAVLVRPGSRPGLTSAVKNLTRQGYANEDIIAGLKAWQARPDAGPGLLRNLVDDASASREAKTQASLTRTAINNCHLCDDRGLIDTFDDAGIPIAIRCDHTNPPTPITTTRQPHKPRTSASLRRQLINTATRNPSETHQNDPPDDKQPHPAPQPPNHTPNPANDHTDPETKTA
ncbi:hypothetical protein [Corynebacterium humireducens]|uniref:hypothetical protein n=1 Tax=Corynebacterium humireducens TaxID=1223514 RepID=UPI000AE10F07|nr:hypothetical protein [Corynebacterium humireducens]